MPYNEPEDKENPLLELETWRDLIQSDNWRYFKELLAEHKAYLEAQVIVSVANRKFEEASDYSARANECSKILSMVTDRLSELKKGSV